MIYTKLSADHNNVSTAEMVLDIPDILGYVKLNLADREFLSITEALNAIAFFNPDLFIAPRKNNIGEEVLGLYLWEGNDFFYTGIYFYEMLEKLNRDSVLWICFEEPYIK